MRFAPDKDNTAYTIRSYQLNQVSIISPATSDNANSGQLNEIVLTHSFIVAPQRLLENWPPKSLTDLTSCDLQAVIDFDPELVILGTGRILNFPDSRLTELLYSKRIGVEIMDTAAASKSKRRTVI